MAGYFISDHHLPKTIKNTKQNISLKIQGHWRVAKCKQILEGRQHLDFPGLVAFCLRTRGKLPCFMNFHLGADPSFALRAREKEYHIPTA